MRRRKVRDLAGYPLGLHFRFLDPSPEAPVGRIAQRVTADFSDQAALERFASGLELVTYEFENVPVEAAEFLAARVPVYPPMNARRYIRKGLTSGIRKETGQASADRWPAPAPRS